VLCGKKYAALRVSPAQMPAKLLLYIGHRQFYPILALGKIAAMPGTP
jgi:hypothetical protein